MRSPSVSFLTSSPNDPTIFNMKPLFPLFLVCSCCFAEESAPPPRAEVSATLRQHLLLRHGSSRGIVAYAERLENERGFPKDETADILLELAGTESYSLFGRRNAIAAFVDLADKDRYDELDRFYSVTNASLRTATQMAILYTLSTTSERLAYAGERFGWLAKHPRFQSDVSHFGGYFQGFLHYSNPTESEKRDIVDFFWNAATNAAFFESAHEAEMLLLRYDPAWPTNEARRAMMEKWKDDPGIHEKTRALWVEALAAFDGTNAVGHAMAGSSASSETDKSWMAGPDTSDPLDSIPALSDGAPVVPDESSKPIREPASSPFRLARIAGTTALLAVLMAAIFFLRKLHRETKSKDRNSTECRE